MTAPLRVFLTALLLLPGLAVAQDQEAQKILNLLDYVSVEYPSFVRNGKVLDPGEYAEQVEFSGQVRDLINGLPANPERAHWAERAKQLNGLIEAKADGAKVAALAREIQHGLITAYAIPVTPKRAPELTAAPALYRANCAPCHGPQGNGAGPQAAGLDPAPSNFQDRERASARSVYGLYNTISLGMEGTSMAPFTQLSADDRWKLAFYVSQFSELQ